MIVLGGSSMHKGANGWQAARAIACLPALTGNVGIPGGGFGPRHGSAAHGQASAASSQPGAGRPGPVIPNQMSRGHGGAARGARARPCCCSARTCCRRSPTPATWRVGLRRTPLVVSYDLFLNDTARRFADVVLPGTAWLEELGCKRTNTHLYLMEQALAPAGETRSLYAVVMELAERLGLDGFHPWASEEAMVDAILDHPCTGHATVAALRAEGGIRALNVSHVANPTLDFDTPSGKIELYSERAARLGLPPLPSYDAPSARVGAGPAARAYPLALAAGADADALPRLLRPRPGAADARPARSGAALWIAPADAAARGLADGAAIRIFNERGELTARAHVTDRIPAGTVWMRDGWAGLNRLTAGAAVLPDAAVDLFAFSAGQATFDAMVEVAPA